VSGKFELYKDVRERYRFRLVSESGELVLSGDGYTQKVLALDAIVSIMRSASEAAVVDMTLPENGEVPIEGDPDLWEEASLAFETDERPRKKKKKRKGGNKRGKGKRPKKSHGSKRGKRKEKRGKR